ncbi:XK-related protein 6-like [Mizuhopecten yessoensis]|uniref:XK-related protein n=1 Tax=Mizuhopecten yessoensis TaxID=6573 RepID=A0A210QK51_MIZYE|nr:XK-related protein 6-like [Mizuhopecten yessoensis]OWF49135.1 XK-related protein 6 [Mizuhopecten yessoensis]
MASTSGGVSNSRCNGLGKRIQTRRTSFKLTPQQEQKANGYQVNSLQLQTEDDRDRTHADRPTQPSATVFLDDVIDQTDGSYRYPFTKIDLFITLFSTLFFLYDFVSDIVLTEEYFRHGRYLAFWLTAAFTVLPAVISNGLSVQWYYLDYTREKQHPEIIGTSMCTWFCRVFFTFPLMMGPAVRHVEYIYHGCKSWTKDSDEGDRKKAKDHHYKQMLYEDNDASLIRMLESFLESAPQLIIQLYIILTEEKHDSPPFFTMYVRPVAMLGSWIGLSWSLVSYHRALRAMHAHSSGLTTASMTGLGKNIGGAIGYFLWRACEVGPRVIIIALFASQLGYIVLVAAGFHWLSMTTWLFFQKTEFYPNRRDEIIFNIVIGYVLVFCFINTRDGHTRFRVIIYYFVFYLENFAMLLSWTYFTPDKSEWFYFMAISVVASGFVCQIVFQLFFYMCCHPEKIEICLNPCKDFMFYRSVCHSLDEADREPPAYL